MKSHENTLLQLQLFDSIDPRKKIIYTIQKSQNHVL